MTELVFTVVGAPAAQGSKRAIIHKHSGKVVTIESSANVQPWRAAVADAATRAMTSNSHPGFPAGPLAVGMLFWVKPPKSLPKRTFSWPWRRPDLDKYVRATMDALGDAGVWRDDAQVVTLWTAKRYAGPEHPGTGAEIIIDTEEHHREHMFSDPVTRAILKDEAELADSIARHPAGKAIIDVPLPLGDDPD